MKLQALSFFSTMYYMVSFIASYVFPQWSVRRAKEATVCLSGKCAWQSAGVKSRNFICRWALLLGLGLLPTALAAQQLGEVTGTLLDQRTRQPLPFASVLLLRGADSSGVAGERSGEDGRFRLEKLALGRYVLRVEVLGYASAQQAVELTATAPSLQLGTLTLTPRAVQLAGVVVEGTQAAVVEDLDKKVINVGKDLNSIGGTTADVLQKVPSIAVDLDGKVSLHGVEATIYVDGKPAPTSLRLDQLPASRLETIEVITNPGARYSAQGTGGILNLVLKKETKPGWNGQATATLGTRDKYTGSINLNHKIGKLNVYGSYDGRANHFYGRTALQQVAETEGQVTRTNQQGTNVRQARAQSIRLGVDYAPSDQESVTFNIETNPRTGHVTDNLATELTRNNTERIALQNQNITTEDFYNGRASTNYRRTWPAHAGRELTANAQLGWDGGLLQLKQRVLDGPASYPQQEHRQDLNVDILMPSAQVDYVRPLSETRRVSVGLKTDVMLTPGKADYLLQSPGSPEYVYQPGLSSRYRYRQYIPAGYVNYQHTVGKWNYQIGLRAEYTALLGQAVGTGNFKQHYLNLFPSATLMPPLLGNQQMRLSYSRRLNRPYFMQIVALPIYADVRNYQVGNPTLRPEYGHSVELGHQLTKGQTTLTTTLFGRFTQNSIQVLREIDTTATRLSGQPDFVTRTSYRNVGATTSYGLELFLNRPLAKWWNVVVNGSFYHNQLASYAGEQTRRTLTGTAYLLNTFSLPKRIDAQLSANYQGPRLLPQGRVAAVYGVDVAVRQRLWHERAALTLRMSDAFNTRRQRTRLYAQGLTTDMQTKYETRIGYLGLTWFLGSRKPADKIDNQPQGDTGGFGR